MMHQPEIDVDDDLAFDFPRDDLSVLLDGLNKWPWTVYPIQLTHCLISAGKIASLGMEEASSELRRLQTLYREAIPSAFEKCLDDKAIWKWSDEIHNNIFDALCRLIDLSVAKLSQLQHEDVSAMEDLLPILRSLSRGFDKQSQYHIKHKEQSRPIGSLSKFARPIPGTPTTKKNGDWYCSTRKVSVREAEGCECSRCKPSDLYCWLSYLLNYFGQTPYGNGYQQLLRVLSHPQKLLPAILEALLQPISKAIEFLTDEVAEAFAEPCSRVLKYVADRLETDVDALSDKTKDGSFAALSSILKHLQIIIARNSSVERAVNTVSVVQRRMVERMLGFHSFNKQLSAVREINKLLENARAIASRDNSLAVCTTIQWLEKNDILREVLRSHLHHKQYVDQVQKIMRFLLQEKRLSEEHLDAIWAATEKPDQFETVKANIFDLIADLAWSFSSEQLDSLFGRFERSQGQSASDIVKILTLVKKLARSDNKGVMASRLLELLWKMMLSGEAPGEILESGAFTEILGHYDSINCASKDVYISRCLANMKEGKFVIPSLRLLRDFIWLDNEKPFYQDEISRQMRLQQLIKDHDLLNMVVSSLQEYMTIARSWSGTDAKTCEIVSPYYTHDEQVKERLDFLLFALQSGGGSLSLEATEKVWNCMIEAPTCATDRERGFYWFCEVLDKWTALSLDAQTNILTKKVTGLDPATMSEAAWRCFLKLFLWVNQTEDKLQRNRNDDVTVTQDLDLLGLPYLWQIALCSPVELIIDQSINLLRDIHTSLSDNLLEDVSVIRQRFISECMVYLTKALDAGVKSSEASESSSIASCSMGEGNGEGVEKMAEKDVVSSSVGEGNKGFENKCFDTDMISSSLHMGEAHQVERCLRILRVFILKCEGRCLRSVPPHTASFQGRPFILGVSTANKQSTRFDVTVHTNEYLSSLRAKVAKLLDHSVSRVRLTYLNRELVQDSQVLWQCGLIGGQTISASVNIVERTFKSTEEQHLPGILISKNVKFFDTLFNLANASDSNVREGANSLLALLPTHPDILNDFQSLCKKDADEARLLLASHFGARFRLLYTLQVLDGLVMPVNRPVDAQTQKFRRSFLEAGGLQHLLAVLEPGALPEGVDNLTRRGCYASSLRLIKFLLSEKIVCEDVGMVSREVSCALREGVTETEVIPGEICGESGDHMQDSKKSVQLLVNKDGLDSVDMASVIGACRRMAWAAAVGQLSAMGIPSSVASVLRKTGGRSAKKRSFPDEDDSGLDPEDQYLCVEALDFMVLCLLKHKYLWRSFFTAADTENFIVAMIIHSPDKAVRYRAALNFMKLSGIRNGCDRIAHRKILTALMGAKVEASQHPKRCLHFWELLGHLFSTIEGAEDREMAEQQLEDELHWLKTAPPAVDDDDRLLEGHLHLIRVLVEVLDKRIIGESKVPEGGGLVQLLVKQFLFPDSAILLHDEEGMNSGNGQLHELNFGVLGTLSESDGLLQPKCGTRGSREKAFQLLICLATHCKESFRELVELIVKIHLSDQVLDWEHLPSYGRKAVGGYVGLKNAGATCYMNSVFQQLFMQPDVRRSVLACTECDDLEKPGSVFFQLQAMFGALLGSSLDHYTPQGFWCAYRDYDGMPINLREHQDAFEFFNRLYDAIDETLKATHQETTLTRIFGGVFAQQVICRGCPHRSEREEPFAAISVDVKNKKDLVESLEAFVRGDLLEGDNAYYCDDCGLKVDALKRVCVKSLPHTLVVHLKRFDFDYETMQRLKLKDRFEFPTHIDMKPYTVEGLALQETRNHVSCSPTGLSNNSSDMNSKQETVSNMVKPDPYYHYDLVGVVVHSGTAFAGHYYSYIKQRPGDHPLNCGSGQTNGWIAFDDKHVEPYDVNDLEKDCFGGKYTVDVYDNFLKTTAPQEFDKPNSAYMLLYERSQQEVPGANSPAQTAMSLTREDEDGDEMMKETPMSERLPNLGSIQMPASVHRRVWEENLRFVHENHLMDKDYFRFLFKLVEVNYDIIDARASRKYRTSTVGATEQQLQGGQIVWGHGNQRNTEEGVTDLVVDEFARLMIHLSTEFLLRVYLRSHLSLREDLPLWKSLISKLFEHNKLACQLFMQALVEQSHWIQDYLIKCPVEEIQQVFASTLVQAMRCGVCFLQGNSLYLDANGRSSDPLQIDALIDILISVLRDPTLPKYSCHQYFQVILDYANIGPPQRFHLLQKSVIGQLVSTTVTFATKVNLQLAKPDFSCLHSIVSLLLRSCDISKIQNIPDVESTNMSFETEDCVATSRQVAAANPLQLPPPLFPVPREAVDSVFRQRLYSTVLIETCPEHEEVAKLLEFCCWQNETFSLWVIQDVLEALQRAPSSEMKPLLALLLRIVFLEDSLKTLRQESLLLGNENFRSGLMAIVVTRVMGTQKRYTLIKFVVKLVAACPAVRVHLNGRKSDWKRVVDWLQEELQSYGSPSSISVPPMSNEDVSNGHLQRTSSAEWTLTNARNLFNS